MRGLEIESPLFVRAFGGGVIIRTVGATVRAWQARTPRGSRSFGGSSGMCRRRGARSRRPTGGDHDRPFSRNQSTSAARVSAAREPLTRPEPPCRRTHSACSRPSLRVAAQPSKSRTPSACSVCASSRRRYCCVRRDSVKMMAFSAAPSARSRAKPARSAFSSAWPLAVLRDRHGKAVRCLQVRDLGPDRRNLLL